MKDAYRIVRKGAHLNGSKLNAMFWNLRIKILLEKFDEIILTGNDIRRWIVVCLIKNLNFVGFDSIDVAVHKTSKRIRLRPDGATTIQELLLSGSTLV